MKMVSKSVSTTREEKVMIEGGYSHLVKITVDIVPEIEAPVAIEMRGYTRLGFIWDRVDFHVRHACEIGLS